MKATDTYEEDLISVGDTFIRLCAEGNVPIPALCHYFATYWQIAPEARKAKAADALILAVARYTRFGDDDISAFESAMTLCRETAPSSTLTLSEPEEKKLANLCLKALLNNEHSPLITILSGLFKTVGGYLNDNFINLQLPFIFLDEVMLFVPKTHRSSTINKAAHGFLFHNQCAQYDLKNLSWNQSDYDHITQRVETIRMWVQDTFGAKYLHLIAPDKQTIYDDICPTDIPEYDKTLQSVINAIERAEVPVVYPKQQLKEGRAARDTYYRTDSHWNDYGAYLAYQATMRELQKTMDVRSLGPDEFGFIEKRAPLDLGGRLVPPFWESYLAADFRDGDAVSFRRNDGSPGSMGAWIVYENRNKTLPTALAFRDSCFTSLAPYFARSFSQLVCIRAQVGAMSIDLLEHFRPDVVICQHIERLSCPCAWERESFEMYAEDLDAGLMHPPQASIASEPASYTYDQAIFDTIVAAIRAQFSTDIEIKGDTVAADVNGWDSLAHFTFLLILESQIGFTFDSAIKYDSHTVGQLAANITKAKHLLKRE